MKVEKIYYLNERQENFEGKHIVYLVRPKIIFMKWIANHIRAFREKGDNRSFTILFAPRSTMLCERALEEEGVYSQVRIEEYHIDLIPYDTDLLSLEFNDCFRDCFIDGDKTSLFYVAKALMRLQTMFGIIPQLRGKGLASQHIVSMMLRMRLEMRTSDVQTDFPAISQLILIDRLTDPTTPMLTMLTYEGLIDEFFGIKNSSVELPQEMVLEDAPRPDMPPKIKNVLNSNDRIYKDTRDVNFSQVGPILNQKAKVVDEFYKNRTRDGPLSELKEMMINVPTYKLRLHTNIVDVLINYTKDFDFHTQLEAEQNLLVGGDIQMSIDYIEECINKQEHVVKVLRLLCLLSLTIGGLKEKQYNFFVKEIVQTYGFEYFFALENLSKVGLLRKQESKFSNWFASLRKLKEFKLIDGEVNEQNPDDINYTYSGYAPISARMVDLVLRSNLKGQTYGSEGVIREGWGLPRNNEDMVRSVPGATFHAIQSQPNRENNDLPEKSEVILVFFVGGVTFPEVSALRFLSQKYEGKDIIVASTNLTNGNTFVEGILEQFNTSKKQ